MSCYKHAFNTSGTLFENWNFLPLSIPLYFEGKYGQILFQIHT